jgi:hypothetical protein
MGFCVLVSEGFASLEVIFPADCPHLSDFHFINEVLKDTGIFQHIAELLLKHFTSKATNFTIEQL